MLSKMPFNSLFLPHARDQTNNISPHFVTEFRTDHVNFWHVSNRGHCRNLICTFFLKWVLIIGHTSTTNFKTYNCDMLVVINNCSGNKT